MAVTKRYSAPKFWPIETKAKKYAVSPRPGPHSRSACIPLGIVLRDVLKHGRNMKEAMQILNSGVVKVNGITRKSHAFPVGLMDVVDAGGDFYRVLPGNKGISLFKITQDDAGLRLAKIRNKTYVRKNKMQLNLHDGSNMLVDKDEYKTSDVIAVDITGRSIKDVVKFEKGAIAIVTDGHNAGLKGVIESIDRKLKTVVLAAGDRKFPVPIKYVFVVGRSQPIIDLGE